MRPPTPSDSVPHCLYALQLGPSVFRTCEGPWDCARMAAERAEQARLAQQNPANGTEVPRWALLRRYHPAWDMLWQDHCTGETGARKVCSQYCA